MTYLAPQPILGSITRNSLIQNPCWPHHSYPIMGLSANWHILCMSMAVLLGPDTNSIQRRGLCGKKASSERIMAKLDRREVWDLNRVADFSPLKRASWTVEPQMLDELLCSLIICTWKNYLQAFNGKVKMARALCFLQLIIANQHNIKG